MNKPDEQNKARQPMSQIGGLQALALVSQLGFVAVAPLVLFIGGGAWLDKTWGCSPAGILTGIPLGLVGGGYGVWRLVRRIIE